MGLKFLEMNKGQQGVRKEGADPKKVEHIAPKERARKEEKLNNREDCRGRKEEMKGKQRFRNPNRVAERGRMLRDSVPCTTDKGLHSLP